jgi:hypothetical protein
MATAPTFDFNDFGRQLQASITEAIKKGLKEGLGKIDTSGIKSNINSLFDDLDVETRLAKPLSSIQNKIKQLDAQLAAGGQDAINIANQQSSLEDEIYMKLARQRAIHEGINQGLSREQRNQIIRRLESAALEGKYDQSLMEQAKRQAKQKIDDLKLAQIRNEKQKDYLGALEATKQKMDRIKLIMTDPKLAKTLIATEGIKLLIKGMQSLRQEFDKFREEGQTITQSLGSTIDTVTLKSVLFGFKTGDALRAAQAELGDLSAASGEAADDMAALAATTGTSAQVAGKLQASLQQLPGATQKTSVETAQFAGNLARAANVAPGKVFDSMANSSEEIAKFSADGGQNFIRAAVGAAKMGVEVGKIAAAAESLLEFENSINKQMEASVLLGREINFDKARELAIQGDLMGATQNMLSQLGGEAEFNRMNLIQKKALAESMGMSVADMGKLVKNQGKFNEAQKEALANGESLDSVLAMGGGFLDKWGAPIKDFAIGVLQAIPTMLVYGAQIKTNTILRGENTAAENTGIFTRIRSTAATAANTIATTANSVARGAWNIVTGIGSAIVNSSIVGWLRETAGKAANTAATIANTIARWLGITAKGADAAANTTLSASNATVAATSGPAAGGIMAVAQAASAGALGMLAFGAAVLMIGGGIAIAALGMAELVKSFKDLTGEQILGAVGSLVVVMGGFVAIIYAMIPAIGALGAVGSAVAVPLLALGAAFLLMGAGIGIAALGLSTLVTSLKDIPFENLLALPLAFIGIGAGLYMIAAAGFAALPILGALTALAVVAPALSGLGDILGGGGAEEESKMDVVVQKLDQLISVVSTPAAVTLDGRKVGDAIRLNINGTAIR